MIIYKLTSPSGKCYVGKTTKSAEERFRAHCWDAFNGCDRPLHTAIRKYGPEAFEVEVLQECDETDANEKEKFWISELRSNVRGVGYNVTEGGDGVDSSTASFLWTEERRERQSRIMTEKWANSSRREAHGQKIKKLLENPEKKKEWTQRLDRIWEDPYSRERHRNAVSKTYRISYMNGRTEVFHGIRNYSSKTGIPEGVLYKAVSRNRPCKKWNIASVGLINED